MAQDDSGSGKRSYTGIPAVDYGDSAPGASPVNRVVDPGDTPETMENFTKSFGVDPDAIPEEAKSSPEPTRTAAKQRGRFFKTLGGIGEAVRRVKRFANRNDGNEGGGSGSDS